MPERDRTTFQYRLPLDYEEPNKNAKIRTILDGMKEQTTAHGIPHISNARGKFKIITWSLITAGFVGVLLWHMRLTFTSYLAFNSKVKLERFTRRQQDFPAVTVCNMCPIKKSALSTNPELAKIFGINIEKKRRRKKRALYMDCSDSGQIDPANGICYGLYDTFKYDYDDAVSKCASIPGGVLAIIDSDNKKTFLDDANSIFSGIGVFAYYHNVKDVSGTFKFFGSVEIPPNGEYDPWYSGYPNLSKGPCVRAGTGGFREQWGNCFCTTTNHVLCQKLHTCPIATYGYRKTCYFLWDKDSTYTHDEADKLCNAVGARLIVLNTQDKYNHLIASGLLTPARGDKYWLNAKQTASSGNAYLWDGTTSFSWDNWDTSQPNTAKACVYGDKNKNNEWYSSDCDKNRHVICEWDMDTSATSEAPTTTEVLTTTLQPTTTDTLTTTEQQTTTEQITTTEPLTTTLAATTTVLETTTELETTTVLETTTELDITTELETTTDIETTTDFELTTEVETTTDMETTELDTTTDFETTTDIETTEIDTTTDIESTTEIDTTTEEPTTTEQPTTTVALTTTEAFTSTVGLTTTLEDTTTSEATTTEEPITTTTTTTTTTVSTTTKPTTTTKVYTTTTKAPPKPLVGSSFPERVVARQDFQQEEQAATALADIPEEAKAAMGFSADDFIVDCEYAGYSCFTSQFATFYSAIHGNCFIFNSWWNATWPTFKSLATGRRYGLKLVVNIDQDEYLSKFGEAAGARIVVHSQDRMPFPEDEGSLARVGQLTSYGIRKVEIERLPHPWGECRYIETNNRDVNMFEEHYPTKYSTSACYKTCYQKYMVERCNCGDPYYPMAGEALGRTNITACDSSNITQDDCKYSVGVDYMTNKLECSCPMACNENLYIPSLSKADWPSDTSLNQTLGRLQSKIPLLLNTGDPVKYKRNLLKIEVFFEEFNFEKIREKESYTMTSFISDIGGVLGLWIGFSVITIAEFMEFFGDVAVYASLKCHKKRKPEEKTWASKPTRPSSGKITPMSSSGQDDTMEMHDLEDFDDTWAKPPPYVVETARDAKSPRVAVTPSGVKCRLSASLSARS